MPGPRRIEESSPDAGLTPGMVESLRRAGLVEGADWTAEPLPGGISSDIFLVSPAGRPRFVVKRALPRLRVQADWQVDPRRNGVEHRWLNVAAQLIPGHVPEILHVDDEVGFFAMEHFQALESWKNRLKSGIAELDAAVAAGTVLGRVHLGSWENHELRHAFATDDLFHALRIEPYLLATARKHAALRAQLEGVAEELARTRLTLVHGDYSPKNMLVGAPRFIVLDAEAGWFGDPAFDAAFMLTHLHLKSLLPSPAPGPEACLLLAGSFQRAYAAAMGDRWDRTLEARTARLLLVLLLARVDGKSPVEYLSAPEHDFIRRFVTAQLPASPNSLAELTDAWQKQLTLHAHH